MLPVPAMLYQLFERGGVVVHQTETVYGLAARWDRQDALDKTARLKQRQPDQPYSLLTGSFEEIKLLVGEQPAWINTFMQHIFPGPITLLLKPGPGAMPRLPFWQRFPEAGIRFPDHALCRALLKAAGAPLITTSANLSGDPPPTTCAGVAPSIRQDADLVLDDGPCIHKTASTILRLGSLEGCAELVRAGAVSPGDLQKLIKILPE